MTVRESFESAKRSGARLLNNESTVTQISSSGTLTRTWLGYDASDNAVAYFEMSAELPTPFSVSQVITVESLRTKSPQTQETIVALKISCHSKKLERVFQGFIDAILLKQPTHEDVVTTVTTAATEWRSLLQMATSDLSENQAIGLYGELMFLEQAIQNIGPEAIDYWQKSARDIHDFIAPGARVETKTSSFQNKMSVTVHGLKQLSVPADSTLTLAVADIQKHGDKDSLAGVIERILNLNVNYEVFSQKLNDSGVVIGMSALEEYGFTLLSWRFWDLDADSPVLSNSTLPEQVRDAVSDVRYSLNLGSLGKSYSQYPWTRIFI